MHVCVHGPGRRVSFFAERSTLAIRGGGLPPSRVSALCTQRSRLFTTTTRRMVLQNKYKARASRRYNAARGALSDSRGRGRGGRGAAGRSHGQRLTEESFPSLPGQDVNDEDETKDSDEETGSDDSEKQRQRQKYAPRSMTSNAWRFADPSEEDDKDTQEGLEEGQEGETSEEEVDLSGLMQRVAMLDSTRESKAISSEQAAIDALDKDAADIDVSLLHLLDRRREREEGKEDKRNDRLRNALTDEERKEMEREGKRLLEEKARQEKHERRARVLQQSSKTISLNIGEGRRKVDEAKMKKSSSHARVNYVADRLYDENDRDEKKKASENDDLDTFLDELVGPNPAHKSAVNVSANVQDNSRGAVKSAPAPARSAPARREDEEFLDSIL